MAKPKKIFRCNVCGNTSEKWQGKCANCGEWNTLEEEVAVEAPKATVHAAQAREGVAMAFDDIAGQDVSRRSTSIEELDRVLGGGVVDGSFVLVGGDPGIGKSTIMLQMAHNLAASGMKVLYVSGEESAVQLKLRGERLGVKGRHILVLAEVMLERIQEQIKAIVPDLIVIDSIQSVFSGHVDAPPGSVSQIRYGAGMLMGLAKSAGIPVFIIGHVTKDGWIAGPKMLEHMVDTVLYFEGDSSGAFRVLRAVKNRFGPSGEIGIFEMKGTGLAEVRDPSGIFMGLGGKLPGSAVMATIEGSRIFLVEVQSLVSRTTFSMPRRTSIGMDQNRLTVLLAVMEKRTGMFLSGSDVVLNVAGGMKVIEPAMDLAAAMAVASSAVDKPLPPGLVCIGEIGLNGELRSVNQMETRIREAIRLGFTQALIPKGNAEALKDITGITLTPVEHLSEALTLIKKGSKEQ
jgi:DNA repair protein RadA/Sms